MINIILNNIEQTLQNRYKILKRVKKNVKSVLEYEKIYGREEGIRTLDELPHTRVPGERLRPLGHLSIVVGAEL